MLLIEKVLDALIATTGKKAYRSGNQAVKREMLVRHLRDWILEMAIEATPSKLPPIHSKEN